MRASTRTLATACPKLSRGGSKVSTGTSAPLICRCTNLPSYANRMISFNNGSSPRHSASSYTEPNFSGLFRLINDFDRYTSAIPSDAAVSEGSRVRGNLGRTQTFSPKFDVKETETAYELHGELPGIERENVHIEFEDSQTIVVGGRVERSYTSGPAPSGLLKGDEVRDASAEGEVVDGSENTIQSKRSSYQPTVEEADEDGTPSNNCAKDKNENNEVVKQSGQQQSGNKQPKPKYWVSERSVGEFSRKFSFPGRVDADRVSATLKDGILSVTVPKAKKPAAKRISIG